MEVLIIGYGSAGKRHAEVLDQLNKVKKIFINTNQDIRSKNKFCFIKNTSNIDPDLIIIANETYKHYSTCKHIEKNFNNKIILCEKPLFHRFYNFKPKKNKFYITYNFRFNECLKYIKKIISSKKVFFIEAESSSYLPLWRKKTDYSKNYSASSKKGGGVLLDMSHEIDYVKWLFKSFRISKIYKKKISFLNIKSNDIALVFGHVNKKALVKIKLTYFNKYPKRLLNICFSDGSQLYLDLLSSKIIHIERKREKILKLKKYSQFETTKKMYSQILRKNFKNICSFKEGLDILKQIKDSKKLNF